MIISVPLDVFVSLEYRNNFVKNLIQKQRNVYLLGIQRPQATSVFMIQEWIKFFVTSDIKFNEDKINGEEIMEEIMEGKTVDLEKLCDDDDDNDK